MLSIHRVAVRRPECVRDRLGKSLPRARDLPHPLQHRHALHIHRSINAVAEYCFSTLKLGLLFRHSSPLRGARSSRRSRVSTVARRLSTLRNLSPGRRPAPAQPCALGLTTCPSNRVKGHARSRGNSPTSVGGQDFCLAHPLHASIPEPPNMRRVAAIVNADLLIYRIL